jgi:hypothetical protein
MAKKKEVKACKCAEMVNDNLRPMNAALKRGVCFNFSTKQASVSPPEIALRRIDGKNRKPLPPIVATYCPFCGKKYPE